MKRWKEVAFVLLAIGLAYALAFLFQVQAAPSAPLGPTVVYQVGFPGVHVDAYPFPTPPPNWSTLPPRPTERPTVTP